MNDQSDGDDSNTAGRRTKVARLIAEYGLEDVGTELEQRWTAEGDDRMSLRELADYFNRRLVAERMTETGLKPLRGETENLYRLLASEEVNDADRTRARRRLEREGIDAEALTDDFVTYQAIRTYLTSHRGAEYETDDRGRRVIESENIQRLRGRTTTVTEGKLEQLENTGNLELGEFQVIVDISVLCEDCGTRYQIEELLERGECDCQTTAV